MSQVNPAPQEKSLKWASHWVFLVAYYSLAVMWGVRYVYYQHSSPLDFFVPLGLSLTLGFWAVSDSIARGHSIPFLSRIWFFIFAGVLVPGYFVWSRGWRGAGYVLLHAVAWYALCLIAMFIGRMFAYGVAFAH